MFAAVLLHQNWQTADSYVNTFIQNRNYTSSVINEQHTGQFEMFRNDSESSIMSQHSVTA